MERRWIFFDRDGTIIVDKHYMHDSADIEFLPFAIEGLAALHEWGMIIVTNQSGIARGLFSAEQAVAFNRVVEERLMAERITIQKSYMCPHHPEFTGTCTCRKPRPGLVVAAAKEFHINLRQSVFVGDKDSDVMLGKYCGGTTFLIDNGQYPSVSNPNYRVKDLRGVANILKEQNV